MCRSRYEFGCDSVTVLATGDSYKISDYSGKTDASGTPIAMLLASLLVQVRRRIPMKGNMCRGSCVVFG